MIGWKTALLISFVIFYMGLSIISFVSDFFAGRATGTDFFSYMTFGKFNDYDKAFQERSQVFFTSEGVLKSDAAISMFFLGAAQLAFIAVLAIIIWQFIPTSRRKWGLVAFLLAIIFASLLKYWATGDPVLGIFKVFYYAAGGVE